MLNKIHVLLTCESKRVARVHEKEKRWSLLLLLALTKESENFQN